MNSKETEIEKEKELEQKVQEYWTCRAHDFSTVRKNELKDNEISGRWLAEIGQNLPVSSGLDILDVGTGTGYFAILLALHGHRTTGIDFTRAMLQEAEETADSYAANASFLYMDAQALDFPDNSFDAIVTRNLTWTIPEPEKAYQEWHRVLRPGGILLNLYAIITRRNPTFLPRMCTVTAASRRSWRRRTRRSHFPCREAVNLVPAGIWNC